MQHVLSKHEFKSLPFLSLLPLKHASGNLHTFSIKYIIFKFKIKPMNICYIDKLLIPAI